jgi:hypothetical protein
MKKTAAAFALILALFLGLSFQAVGSQKFTKETGKNCKFCHSSIPKKDATDPLLTEEGQKFKDNGNQLTDDQK